MSTNSSIRNSLSSIKNLKDYHSQFTKALSQPKDYWSEVAKNYNWISPWTTVQSGSLKDANVKWFDGGKLNITENCLDRHIINTPDKLAIIWEPNNPTDEAVYLTYKELGERVNQMANVFKNKGVKKGDTICFYMSMVPELLIGLLASARIGAIHSVVFGGFSAQALSGRLNDSQCKLLMTNDGSFRGKKLICLKNIVDEALLSAPEVKTVVVVKHSNCLIKIKNGRDVYLADELKNASKECVAEPMSAEDPLFILYTSGSTGTPKGVVHTTAGYMVWVGETFKNVFQMTAEDLYWCTADIGWITGHSYLTYGPLLNGVTSVMFEGIPTYPDHGRFWQVIDKYQVTHFYTAPTALRSLMAVGDDYVLKQNLSSLKVLGTVGEPINEEAWTWYHKLIGKNRCPIVDTWWQTETGGIMISSLAGVTPAIPTAATLPMPGVELTLMNDKANILTDSPAEGYLCISKPWPGMARTIWKNHERYVETYFSSYPGHYFTGDGAQRDAQNNYRITGRVDDVMNISGHRIGTAEVEDAIDEYHDIIESAVVGYPHPIKGQGILAYVILRPGAQFDTQLHHEELNKIVTKHIGPIAKPDQILIVHSLPKTRSGKIMRRILRKIAAKEFDRFGDISTLLNPECVNEIIAQVKTLNL